MNFCKSRKNRVCKVKKNFYDDQKLSDRVWPKEYRDYKKDEPLKKWRIEPGKGMAGCEMHERNGWGHMSQKGKHTWDIIITYHRCPKCGFIFENREEYQDVLGKYLKSLQCGRCGNSYTIENQKRSSIGPIFGEPGSPEVEWRNE